MHRTLTPPPRAETAQISESVRELDCDCGIGHLASISLGPGASDPELDIGSERDSENWTVVVRASRCWAGRFDVSVVGGELLGGDLRVRVSQSGAGSRRDEAKAHLWGCGNAHDVASSDLAAEVSSDRDATARARQRNVPELRAWVTRTEGAYEGA